MEITESFLKEQEKSYIDERARLIEMVRTFDGAIQAIAFLLTKLEEPTPASVAEGVKE